MCAIRISRLSSVTLRLESELSILEARERGVNLSASRAQGERGECVLCTNGGDVGFLQTHPYSPPSHISDVCPEVIIDEQLACAAALK